MHTITIYVEDSSGTQLRPVEYQYPGEWSEITPEQFKEVAQILALTASANDAQDTTVAKTTSRVLLLQRLAQIPPEHIALVDADSVTVRTSRLVDDGVHEPREEFSWSILPSLDWCFSQPIMRTSMLPAFDHDGTTWTGPADFMSNISFQQFAFADELLAALAQNPDDALLDKFLAALYHPQGRDWSNLEIEPLALRLSSLTAITKVSAVLNYRALRGFIAEKFPHVFTSSDEQPLQSGLFGVIYDVTASGVFGDIDKTEKRPLLQVLGYMEHMSEKDQREAQRIAQSSPT